MTGSNERALAAVAIGRNEGERLVACLKSLLRDVPTVIYVDSGSTDASAQMAARLGARVVALDMSKPFTAARARNAGFDALTSDATPRFVQFVDGDCEVEAGWLEAAQKFLDERDDVALVAGRRRERFPAATIFNRLCDIEWATKPGEAKAAGGDFLVRAEAFRSVNGFNPALIAGEEPELCFRLREKGWKIWRLDQPMTIHDAAMTRISQWWTRARRAGYAYANGFALHGKSPERFRRREVMRSLLFGAVLPAAALVLGAFANPWFFLFFLYYPVQAFRIYLTRSDIAAGRFAYAISCAAARFPEAQGMMQFYRAQRAGRQEALIEYK